MLLNASSIRIDSVSTIRYANQFIDNLRDLSDQEFDAINETAQESIIVSTEVLKSLNDVNLERINITVNSLRSSIIEFSTDNTLFLSEVESLREETSDQYNRSQLLTTQYYLLQSDITNLKRSVQELYARPNYTFEANEIGANAGVLKVTLELTNASVLAIGRSVKTLEGEVLKLGQTVNESVGILTHTVTEGIYS